MNEKKQVYIIAEAGVNHNGSLEMAFELIDVAAQAGADAVKFQTFQTEKCISVAAPKAEYQTHTTDVSETQYQMIKKLELDRESHIKLVSRCAEKNIQFLSTPFDLESIDFLANTIHVPLIKVASGEITNAPLLLKAAQTGKPIILSTGMCTLAEIEAALGVLAFGYVGINNPPSVNEFQLAYISTEGQRQLKEKVTLLHCTTEYPAPFGDVNLRVISTMQTAFGLPVGYSDHTEGIAVPIAAVACGAMLIEKHFTLDRSLPGPDHKASLEPAELVQMVNAIRNVELALGSHVKIPAASEMKNRNIARKSLVAACPIKKGAILTGDNVTFKRPGTGISPMMYWDVLGTVAGHDYEQDEVIR